MATKSRLIYGVDISLPGPPSATTIYAATKAHTRTSTYYSARLVAPPSFNRTPWGGARTRDVSEIGSGSIRLLNSDGAFDSMRSRDDWDDGRGVMWVADTVTGTQYPILFFLTGRPSSWKARELVIPVRDAIAQYDKAMMTTKYAGTNSGAPLAGIEGVADIKGRPKPLCLGTVFNIEPICVNTTRLIYQVDGMGGLRTGYTLTPYDRRAAIAAGAVYASQADMETNAPAAGQHRVWPAGGCFRLNAAPVGKITADVSNPADTAALPGGWTGLEAQIILRRFLYLYGGAAESNNLNLNANTKAGVYITDETTYFEALRWVCESVGLGFWLPYSPNLNWVYGAGGGGGIAPMFRQHNVAASSKTLALVEGKNCTLLDIVDTEDADAGARITSYTVNYRRNGLVMSRADAPGLTEAQLEDVKKEYLSVTGTSPAHGSFVNAGAPELVVNTLFADSASASQRLVELGGSAGAGLYQNGRVILKVSVPDKVWWDWVWDTSAGPANAGYPFGDNKVSYTGSRFGLSGGKVCDVLEFFQVGRTIEAILIGWTA